MTFVSSITNQEISLDSIWTALDELSPKVITQKTGCKCGTIDIIELDCYTVCNSCGLILEDLSISTEAEWRSFNNENGMSDTGNRCGNEIDTLAPIHSMATVIAGNSKLAKRQLWSSLPYNERVLYELKNNLNIIIASNNLPGSLCKNTLLLYKKFTNKDNVKDKDDMNLFRGNNKNTLIAVCFYYAAKFHNINLSSSYICNIFNVKNQKFSKYCKIYNEYLGNQCDNTVYEVTDLCERYSIKLNLSWNIQKLCKKILQACKTLNILTELAPQSLISGVIYFINIEMHLELSKNDIYNACGISENTMIKTYRILATKKQEIFTVAVSN